MSPQLRPRLQSSHPSSMRRTGGGGQGKDDTQRSGLGWMENWEILHSAAHHPLISQGFYSVRAAWAHSSSVLIAQRCASPSRCVRHLQTNAHPQIWKLLPCAPQFPITFGETLGVSTVPLSSCAEVVPGTDCLQQSRPEPHCHLCKGRKF